MRTTEASVHTGNILVLYDPSLTPDDVVAILQALCDDEPFVPTAAAVGPVRSSGAVRGDSTPDAAWHAGTIDAVLVRIDSTGQGLTAAESATRLRRYGANELEATRARPLSDIVLSQFKSLPVLLLVGSSVLSVATGGLADAIVIIGVIALNAAIGAYTEAAAERNIRALTRFTSPPVPTVRDGAQVLTELSALVPGDVIHVRRGDYVPADARLLTSTDLSVAESALTGESAPVTKDATAQVDERVPLGERVTMIFRGTVVTGGTGVAVVVATGRRTELGQVQAMLAGTAQPQTPLQRQLETLGHQMVLVTVGVCGAMVVLGWLRGLGLLQTVRTAISLAVAAIPEGLPTVSTMTLASGVRRMRQRGMLVRRLDALETLGAVQVICLDKTGTITANRMAVQAVFADGRRWDLAAGDVASDGDDALGALLRIGVLCSDAAVLPGEHGEEPRVDGTPTEAALVQLALARGMDVAGLRAERPTLSHLERSERRMYMSTAHAAPGGRRMVATKGRPDQVLSLCESVLAGGSTRPFTTDDRATIEAENEWMAGQGLRVLGFAYAEVGPDVPVTDVPLTWVGLAGIADPVRPGTRPLIEAFHAAGIQTVMITGDQSATACAVARAVSLPRSSQLEVLDSTGLAGIPEPLLSALVGRVDVFSRVSPSNKLQIVRGLQRAGLVVAMTGDGINDGPALRASDVGIAMGRGGSELAREVADIVLLEDDVTALLEAIADGRTTADDIRKSVHFIIATNLSEILLTLGATAFGFGIPLSATQLLWINLLTDVFPELALAVDPAESDVLSRPPRPAGAPLVAGRDVPRLTLDGVVMTGAAMTAYAYGLRRYGANGGAGTLAFMTLTGAQLLHALSARSESRSVLDWNLPPNPWLGLSVAAGFGVQVLGATVPGLRRVLGLAPVAVGDMALSWGFAALSFVLGETAKIATHLPARPAHVSERPGS